MKRTTILLLLLSALAKADWFDEYSKRHPSNPSQVAKESEECKKLQDPKMQGSCLEHVDARNGESESSEEGIVYDEQTTIVISGEETTRTITTIKSHSGKEIARAIDGVKGALYLSILLSLAMSIIGFTVIASTK